MDECIFCKIISGAIPSPRVYEDDHIIAIRDINPQAPVHILLMPKKHLPSVGDVTDAEASLINRMILAATRLAKKEGLGQRGFRLLTNAGPEGGQAVPHLHFHLLGGRQMGWPPG